MTDTNPSETPETLDFRLKVYDRGQYYVSIIVAEGTSLASQEAIVETFVDTHGEQTGLPWGEATTSDESSDTLIGTVCKDGRLINLHGKASILQSRTALKTLIRRLRMATVKRVRTVGEHQE